MLIRLGQEHIDNGTRNSAFCGPATLAINEAFSVCNAGVSQEEIWIDGTSRGRIIRTPPALADWINRYNAGKPVEPLTFDLPIETETAPC